MSCGLNLLHTLELISNCRTVTTMACITPGHDGSVFQDRSKGHFCGLNVLHTLELMSNCRTVTAKVCVVMVAAPGNDFAAISMTPQCKRRLLLLPAVVEVPEL